MTNDFYIVLTIMILCLIGFVIYFCWGYYCAKTCPKNIVRGVKIIRNDGAEFYVIQKLIFNHWWFNIPTYNGFIAIPKAIFTTLEELEEGLKIFRSDSPTDIKEKVILNI